MPYWQNHFFLIHPSDYRFDIFHCGCWRVCYACDYYHRTNHKYDARKSSISLWRHPAGVSLSNSLSGWCACRIDFIFQVAKPLVYKEYYGRAYPFHFVYAPSTFFHTSALICAEKHEINSSLVMRLKMLISIVRYQWRKGMNYKHWIKQVVLYISRLNSKIFLGQSVAQFFAWTCSALSILHVSNFKVLAQIL